MTFRRYDSSHAIGEGEDDLLNRWLRIGNNLLSIREECPNFDGSFVSNCRMHGIVLTNPERTAAMWWADLTAEKRDTLRREFPDRLRPGGLREKCREAHPEWRKKAVSNACAPRTGARKRRQTPKTASPSEAAKSDEVPKLNAADKKWVKEQLRQDALAATPPSNKAHLNESFKFGRLSTRDQPRTFGRHVHAQKNNSPRGCSTSIAW